MIRITVFLIFFPAFLFAQQTQLRFEEIEQLQASGEYFTAIDALNELLLLEENNIEAIYALATNYRLTFQYDKALAQYRKAFYLNPEKDAMGVYYLALMLKYTGSYEEAIFHFTDFINISESTDRYPDFLEQAKVKRAGAEMAFEFKGKQKFNSNLLPEPVNSEFNDYAPVAINDSLFLIT
ncbi:MAG: hypothetical protein P8X57_12490, partial [Cyclobacteriaceae bacterium]